MRALTWDIPYQNNSEAQIKITPFGDIHLGALACQEREFARRVEQVASEPNHYWIGMGDMCDAIGRNGGDKRSDEANLAAWLWGEPRIFEKERERLKQYILPIAGKCLGMLEGNHDDKVLRMYGQDMYYSVCEAVQRAAGHDKNLALGYAGFIRLRFRRQWEGQEKRANKGGLSSIPFTIYATHGYGGGRKAGGKANKLTDMAGVADADLYLFGHVHAPELAMKEQRMSMSQKGRVESRTYAAVLTGTYLKGYTEDSVTYSERFGFAEAPIGSPIITLNPVAPSPDQTIQVTI